MCGITGYWSGARAHHRDAEAIISSMASAIDYRGPDSWGFWGQDESGAVLGHRRLSILDLSEHGHQPMVSASGRFVLTYNGEIYNHLELREELPGDCSFHGSGDTEVLLAALEHWGVEATLARLNGMFAFALWDRQEKTLSLAIDRLGIKPLYYGVVDGAFVFGSELKAIMAFPGFRPEVNRGALAGYMSRGFVWGGESIFAGVRRMTPGTFLVLREHDAEARERQYWSILERAESARREPFLGSREDAVEELDQRLRSAVSRRMISDVSLGAFLSGGIDSSTIVALMSELSREDVRTFSIGFESRAYDESSDAREVARLLRTDHSELIVSSEDALALVPTLADMYDEPFADSSQIPTHLVCRLAREHVTVALSGDGGDELFAGYNRHVFAPRIWSRVAPLPFPARRALAKLLRGVSPAVWRGLFGVLGALAGGKELVRVPEAKVQKLAKLIEQPDFSHVYEALCSHWGRRDGVVLGGEAPGARMLDQGQSFANQMMLQDILQYLPGDILTKVDRASMAVSLEARVPFLDHELVEFAQRLPLDYKLHDAQGKWVLRQVLERYVSRELFDRPKMGFGIPLAQWLRGPLREWASDLLSEETLRRQGFFDVELVRQKWLEHASGRADWEHHLWCVLMFQTWSARYMPG